MTFRLADSIPKTEISGSHLNLIKEPYVGELAAKLRECLEAAHQRNVPPYWEQRKDAVLSPLKVKLCN